MTTFQTTLRPGLLVALKTSIGGNVKHLRNPIEAGRITETGEHKSKWETERTILNPKEQEAAAKARTKARGFIAAVCSTTAFGYLCPESAKADLDAAVANARKVAEEFNATATVTRLWFNVISGRIAPDDVEAVKAINGEVRDLLADMKEGIEKLDVKAIRDAATRAKQIGQMLSPDAQARITIAIEAARAVATKINAAGEQAAAEIDRRTIATLTECRTAFLDLDPTADVVVPVSAGRAVDFTPTGGSDDAAKKKTATPAVRGRQMDL